MHPHETLLARLFQAIGARDAAAVARCYHADVFFTDPLFPRLRGEDAARRWRFVFEAVSDWRLEVHEVGADEDGGHASWTARYRVRGREVSTRGRSLFAFREGLVCRHYDAFSLWRWAAAVLGPGGAVLGWFGPFRWALRQSVATRLEREP